VENEEKEESNKFQWAVLIVLIIAWIVNIIAQNRITGVQGSQLATAFFIFIIFALYRDMGKLEPNEVLKVCGVKSIKISKLLLYVLLTILLVVLISIFILPKIFHMSGYYLVLSQDDLEFRKDVANFGELPIIISSATFFLYQTFLEELLFRGILLRKLLYKYNFWIANVIQSVVFGLIHLPIVLSGSVSPNDRPFNLSVKIVVGFLFGYAYAKTDNNLFPSWVSHFLVNFSHILLLIFFGIST
jgi:hypothetical protein